MREPIPGGWTNAAGDTQRVFPEHSNGADNVGKDVGKVQHLHDALEPVKPEHEELKVVEHTGERAYTLAAVPDSLASSFECEKRSTEHPYTGDDAAQKVYGNHYAMLFTFRTAGDHPAALRCPAVLQHPLKILLSQPGNKHRASLSLLM